MDITGVEYLEEFEDVIKCCLPDKIQLNEINNGINVKSGGSTMSNSHETANDPFDPLLCTENTYDENKDISEESVFNGQNVIKSKKSNKKVNFNNQPDFIDCGASDQTKEQIEPVCTFSPKDFLPVNISSIISNKNLFEQSNKKRKRTKNESSDFIYTKSKNYDDESKNKKKSDIQKSENSIKKTEFVHKKKEFNIKKLKVLVKKMPLNIIREINEHGVYIVGRKREFNRNKNKRKEKKPKDSNLKTTKINKKVSQKEKTQITKTRNKKTVELKKQFNIESNQFDGILDEIPIEQSSISKLPINLNVTHQQPINSITLNGKYTELPEHILVETKLLTRQDFNKVLSNKKDNKTTISSNKNKQKIIKSPSQNISIINNNVTDNNHEDLLNEIDTVLNNEIAGHIKANNLRNTEGYTVIAQRKRDKETALKKFDASTLVDVLAFLKTYLPLEKTYNKNIFKKKQNRSTKIKRNLTKDVCASTSSGSNNTTVATPPRTYGKSNSSSKNLELRKIRLPVTLATTVENSNIQNTKTLFSTSTPTNNQNLNTSNFFG